MTPVYQTRFGQDGNCWAAALATILGVPLEEVDHLSNMDDPGWFSATQAYLAERGMYYVEYQWASESATPLSLSLLPQGELLIATTKSHNGLHHAIIVEVHHNPIPVDGLTQMDLVIVHDPLGHHKAKDHRYRIHSIGLLCQSFTLPEFNPNYENQEEA